MRLITFLAFMTLAPCVRAAPLSNQQLPVVDLKHGGTGYAAPNLAMLRTYLGIGAGGAWGTVTGDIALQTDLATALGSLAPLTGVGTSGVWPIGITGNAATASTLTNPSAQPFPNVFNVKSYGAVGNGVTDDTAAIQTAIQAAHAASGGTVYFPAAVYRVNGALVLPNDGIAFPNGPNQRALRFTGDGGGYKIASAVQVAPSSGSVLDMRWNGTGPAKIDTRGFGVLEISGMSFIDAGGDAKPFIQTTNTTLHIRNCGFYGSKTGQACDQDAIILGGTSAEIGGGGPNAEFSGYGTVIRDNSFGGIRRVVYGRSSCNNVTIASNSIGPACGAADGTAAAIHMSAGDTVNTSNIIKDNVFETTSYPYSILLDKSSANTISGNGFWDQSAATLSYIHLQNGSVRNVITDGYNQAGVPMLSGATGSNSRITNDYATQSGLSTGGSVTLVPQDGDIASRIYTMEAGLPASNNGGLRIYDHTANATRLNIASNGSVSIPGTLSTGPLVSNALHATTAILDYGNYAKTSVLRYDWDATNTDMLKLGVPGGSGIDTALTLTAAGRVGIGNTSPTCMLDVTGAGKVSGTLDTGTLRVTTSAGVPATVTGATTADYAGFEFHDQTGAYKGTITYGGTTSWAPLADKLTIATNTKDIRFSINSGSTDVLRIKGDIGNIGIGTISPAATALLDVASTTQGFLPPRMTTTQRDAIASPAEGLMVWNTTTHKLNVKGLTAWEVVTSS